MPAFIVLLNEIIGTATNHLNHLKLPMDKTGHQKTQAIRYDGDYGSYYFRSGSSVKQDAIDGVWAQFQPNSSLPDDGQNITVSGVSVTIHK